MSIIFSDNFNRADNASMGGSWVDNAGDYQIKSNKAYAASLSTAYNSTSVGSANYKASIGFTYSTTLGDWVELLVRSTGTTKFDNCYFIYVQNYSDRLTVGLYKRVSGSQSQLGSTYTVNTPSAVEHTYTLSANGSAIKVYYDTVEVISVTDTAHTLEGVHGIRQNTGYYCDNYVIEDFSTTVSFIPWVTTY